MSDRVPQYATTTERAMDQSMEEKKQRDRFNVERGRCRHKTDFLSQTQRAPNNH